MQQYVIQQLVTDPFNMEHSMGMIQMLRLFYLFPQIIPVLAIL